MANEISVLMSVHDKESVDNLRDAMRSLHKQTLPPSKIILIEDGPLGQELRKEIRRWQRRLRSRLLRIKNKTNMGLTASLNRSMEYVTTPFVARMDSDDISHSKRFERQIRFLLTHPDIAVVGGFVKEFDLSGIHNLRQYPLTHEDALRLIHRSSPLAHPAVMMRSEIFHNGIRYDERYRTSQDIALWFDLICADYHIANIPYMVLYFRLSESIYKRRGRDKAWDEFRIYCNGIRRLHGIATWRYIWPLGRLCCRLLPSPLIKILYRSKLRKMITRS